MQLLMPQVWLLVRININVTPWCRDSQGFDLILIFEDLFYFFNRVVNQINQNPTIPLQVFDLKELDSL